jgi:hypothetical protein
MDERDVAMTTTYTIWDSSTSECIGKDVDLVRAMSLLAELPSETAAEFLEQAGPPGSIALERYGFTVLVDERNDEDAEL